MPVKLFWVLTFLFMISITLGALRGLMNVWIDSPTIIFIENTESSIQDIPFPSINICPSNQLRKWVWEKHMNTNSSYWIVQLVVPKYFNQLKSNWNLDDGYPPNSEKNILVNINPARTSGITLSNPAEYFLLDPRSFIKPDTYTRIKITPFVKKIDSQLKWRSPEIRKCYLHNERKLSIFQQYTQGNCNFECVLNETLSICGCVSIDMVYLVSNSVKICGSAKKECMIKAQ
ncbi:PREDICTED: pickpocket protein 11-like, partial [Diuraphis noxia]|uniref:pickpocket protein 11-like n=1 Tax=Diuraphis noxia TaxID=143948 RepID=UPI0007639C92